MKEEISQSKLVRDYAASEQYKSVEAQFSTEVGEETLFNKVLEEGRDLTERHSELQRARHWYDCQAAYESMIDGSSEGGKLLKEFTKKQMERTREAVIKGDLRDFKVYTDIDMEKIKLAMRRECLKFPESCAKSFEKPEVPAQNMNPYEKNK